uniref:Uncharacterized protein n=1 Tax=Lactuca sativa TaxID=4236 RepID=A0A9R1X6Z2_LACSA|nr:hypothetical protein LSAT_V11C600329910 [Lactuca sativa]
MDSENTMWHIHEYEVKNNFLFLPSVPGPVERQDLEKVVKIYRKTINFWQVDRGNQIPLGLPRVMMDLTCDGQLYPNLTKETDAMNVRRTFNDYASTVQVSPSVLGPGGKSFDWVNVNISNVNNVSWIWKTLVVSSTWVEYR